MSSGSQSIEAASTSVSVRDVSQDVWVGFSAIARFQYYLNCLHHLSELNGTAHPVNVIPGMTFTSPLSTVPLFLLEWAIFIGAIVVIALGPHPAVIACAILSAIPVIFYGWTFVRFNGNCCRATSEHFTVYSPELNNSGIANRFFRCSTEVATGMLRREWNETTTIEESIFLAAKGQVDLMLYNAYWKTRHWYLPYLQTFLNWVCFVIILICAIIKSAVMKVWASDDKRNGILFGLPIVVWVFGTIFVCMLTRYCVGRYRGWIFF